MRFSACAGGRDRGADEQTKKSPSKSKQEKQNPLNYFQEKTENSHNKFSR